MPDYKVKIALAPIRRDVTPRPGVFNWEKAEVRAYASVKFIREHFTTEKVSFVGVEGINPRDIIITEDDARAAALRFKEEKVDAVFLINCNFGNEEAAGLLAREMGLPVLLWGPLDDEYAEDGMRYTDSQCGLFGMSRQLQRLHIPFTYIENCRITDKIFADGLKSFARVACMVKNFKGLRIAQVGLRPKPFCSVMFNEGELLSKFGIQTVPVNLAVVLNKYNEILENNKEELKEGAALLASRYEMDDLTPPLLEKVYAFVILYRWIFKEYKVDAVSAECWTAMQQLVGAMPCTAYSILADEGYIISCESDMHGAITMLLLSCASMGESIPFFGEFTVRHPEGKNAELLWHCGPFAYSLKDPASKAKNVNMRQWFKVKDGDYTIARFEQNDGDYAILEGHFKTTDGPLTFGTYLWAEFPEGASAWEKKLIEGPYIHHMAEIAGDYTSEIKEFCKYIPGLKTDRP